MKLLFSGFLALLFSCSPKTEKGEDDASILEFTAKKIEIRFAGEVQSRKTFSDLMGMDNEKEWQKLYAEREKTNPLVFLEDTLLVKRFEQLGIIRDRELLLDNFKYDSLTKFQLTDIVGNKINIQFDFVQGRLGQHKIRAFRYQDSTGVTIPGIMQDLKYALLDIIPGGNKEIVVLNEWYISNGYNFDLLVYEIKN